MITIIRGGRAGGREQPGRRTGEADARWLIMTTIITNIDDNNDDTSNNNTSSNNNSNDNSNNDGHDKTII